MTLRNLLIVMRQIENLGKSERRRIEFLRAAATVGMD